MSKKPRTTCRLIHDWTKWTVAPYRTWVKGAAYIVARQERTCNRCGRTQVEQLT